MSRRSPPRAHRDAAPPSHGDTAAALVWPDGIPRDAVPVPLTVLPERAGMRLDKFITIEMPRLSRTRAARIAEQFAFLPNGTPLGPSRIVRAGETVVLYRLTHDEPPVPRDVPVLFEDASIVVVDKPAGLPVHPTARYHRNTLVSILAERFAGERLALCHRLDKETSGVLVAARTPSAERTLKDAFAGRDVKKHYRAIVHGRVESDAFVVDAPMALEGGEVSVRMCVRPLESGGLPSVTRVRVVQRFDEFTLVDAAPETGRQHQIRVHLAHVGHPIVGDKLYAHGADVFLASLRGELDEPTRRALLLDRHALHAHEITFAHPTSGDRVTICAPLPADLQAFIDARRKLAGTEPTSSG